MFKKKIKPWNEYLQNNGSTDLKQMDKRINDRLTFIGINEDTLRQIKEVAHIIAPFKSEIVDKFYAKITAVQHLQQIITSNSTVDRLRKTMEKYLDQFLQAEVNQEYINTRIQIGKVHSRIRLTAEHFISAHNLLLQSMTMILMKNLHQKPNLMMQSVLAIQKLASFDQQLIVAVYMEDTIKTSLFGVSDMINHLTQLDTTKQLITAMDKQIEESHSVTAATQEMSASIQEVAHHSIRVAEGTDEAVQSAERSKQVINTALGAIQQVGSVYNDVLTRVHHLNQEITQTQDVIKIIREVADQTNLLALNASIEAARAGEHGRGFSVVATEVRKLAEHTKEQISQITEHMESLQNLSSLVTEQIGDTGKLVEQSVGEARDADEALYQIVLTMQEINQSTSQIAAMTEEQTSSVMEIASRNSISLELSMHSQEIGKTTARLINELSQRMDHYRISLLSINVNLDSKDIVRVAKTDHLLWKWRIYNMLLGIIEIDPNQVGSHEACRLGKWYYGDLPSQITTQFAYKQLEEPHKAVHDSARLAVERYAAGDVAGAQRAFEQLQKASDQVIDLLSQLEEKIA